MAKVMTGEFSELHVSRGPNNDGLEQIHNTPQIHVQDAMPCTPEIDGAQGRRAKGC